MAWTAIWTDATTVKEHLQQTGSSVQDAVAANMIVEAIGLAESTMIKRGIASTVSGSSPVENETLVSGATLLAVAYCERSEARKALIRASKEGKEDSVARRLLDLARDDEAAAWLILEPFFSTMGGLRTTVIRQNKNWARDRGGALHRHTEAGRHKRDRDPA